MCFDLHVRLYVILSICFIMRGGGDDALDGGAWGGGGVYDFSRYLVLLLNIITYKKEEISLILSMNPYVV